MNAKQRRVFLKQLFAGVSLGTAGAALTASAQSLGPNPYPETKSGRDEPFVHTPRLRVTRLETMLVKPRWLFLKVHTDEGVVGLGEPILEGRARTCAEAVQEIAPYLVGKDPRLVMHHWQAIYRHAFYRGGPLLTSVLSGIEQALWDIKGKLLGVPIYELLGGPTRGRVKVYAHVGSSPERLKEKLDEGFRTFKASVFKSTESGIVATQAFVEAAADNFRQLREAAGKESQIGIDFHGAITPQTAKLLIRALEPYQPMFIEEPVQCQNVDVMAEIARGTHLPIATGERVFTKWGFREVLEKGAASILQPDLCHCGGIMEARLIAGMGEAYYASLAPHNPLGPISLAAGMQLAASVPNFLCQEQRTFGEGYLKKPFRFEDGGFLALPEEPGLGIELDEEKLGPLLGHDWRNRERYDPEDGSVVDW